MPDATRIILVQYGPPETVLLLTSALIGLKKIYNHSKVLWVGEPQYFSIIKFDKRIHKKLNIHKGSDLASLTYFYGSDICYNPSMHKTACTFASITGSKYIFGFNKNGPTSKSAEFFQKVMSGNLRTCKTILELYYGLANIRWNGEGYGLTYYPSTKQNKDVGVCMKKPTETNEQFCTTNDYPELLNLINQYKKIITDNLLVAHMSLSLRKKVEFHGFLTYKLNFGCHIV